LRTFEAEPILKPSSLNYAQRQSAERRHGKKELDIFSSYAGEKEEGFYLYTMVVWRKK